MGIPQIPNKLPEIVGILGTLAHLWHGIGDLSFEPIKPREKMNKLIPYKELFQLKENEEELTERLSQELTLEERIEIDSKLEWYKSLIKKFKNEIQIIESDISSSSSSSSSSGSLSSSSSSYGGSTSSESSSAASSKSFSSSSSYSSSSTSEEVQDLGSTAQETSDIWHC